MATNYNENLTMHVFRADGIEYYFYAVNDSIAVEINSQTRFWVHRNGYPYTEEDFQRHCINWVQSAAKNISDSVAKWGAQ